MDVTGFLLQTGRKALGLSCFGFFFPSSFSIQAGEKVWLTQSNHEQGTNPPGSEGDVSQNHRMVGVGRDLCGSPSPTPCRSRVTQSRLHSTASRQVLNNSNILKSNTSGRNLGSTVYPQVRAARSLSQFVCL